MNKVSMSYLFPFHDIKQNELLSSYLDNWWRHKLKDLSNGRQGKTDRRMEIKKFEYFKKKSFLDEIKSSIFIVFEGLSFGEKIKNNEPTL